MTDNMDKLLYSIGEEANGEVDFAQMYSSLLAESGRKKTTPIKTVKYLGMAAACVAVLGIAAMLPNGLSMGKAESQVEYAVAEEAPAAAPAEAAPAAGEAKDISAVVTTADGAALEIACENSCDAEPAEAEAEECVAEEEAMAESPAAESDQAETGVSGASMELFEIGVPSDGFEQYLREVYPGIVMETIENSAIAHGYAHITVTEDENSALWNTGSSVLRIQLEQVKDAEVFADILRSACEN